MIFQSPAELADRIVALTGRRLSGPPVVTEDTSDYLAITSEQVVRLAGHDYYILGDMYEGRFGISDQPKFWVKRAIDLSTGSPKIIKLHFLEAFSTGKGALTVRAFRSPDKESAILALVEDHPNFMHGISVRDSAGNNVRVLEFIRGATFLSLVHNYPEPHEEYFYKVLPALLRNLVPSLEAIAFLARNGQHHGDIRNDHILVDQESGRYRWIDFDLSVNFAGYDLWSLGNILTYAAAKGILRFQELADNPERFPLVSDDIMPEDTLLYFPYRIANLRKIYPYIHPELNRVLMRFSKGTEALYADFEELLADLGRALSCWP